MLSAERTVPKPPGVELWPRPPAFIEVPPLTLGGGGTTWLAAVMPSMARLSGERPPTSTGGGTTFGSPRLPPETVRSFVTCEGGGAITAGAGMLSFADCVPSRMGALTGGGTMIVFDAAGPRNGGGSRGTSVGDGCTIGDVIETTERD